MAPFLDPTSSVLLTSIHIFEYQNFGERQLLGDQNFDDLIEGGPFHLNLV
jgi:hypothetical protein